jgi:hypothetical protein
MLEEAEMRLIWEHIRGEYASGETATINIFRAKVPGGWFIWVQNGIIFYSDPDHNWDGNSLP